MLSVIIPIYNGEKFIKRCYQSIINQSLEGLEIIFVNDGSADNSANILHHIQANDSSVKVITQENKGVIVARRVGVDNATSNYVTFLDVDDFFLADSLNHFLSHLNDDLDIIVGDFSSKTTKQGLISADAYLNHVLTTGGWELWGKIYKASLFQNIYYPSEKIRIGEDALILIQLILQSKKISVYEQSFYNYNIHAESASNIQSEQLAIEGMYAASVIEDIFQENKITERSNEINAMFLLFYSNSLRRGYIKDKKIRNDIKKRITPNSLKLINIKKSIFILSCFWGGSFVHKILSKFL